MEHTSLRAERFISERTRRISYLVWALLSRPQESAYHLYAKIKFIMCNSLGVLGNSLIEISL